MTKLLRIINWSISIKLIILPFRKNQILIKFAVFTLATNFAEASQAWKLIKFSFFAKLVLELDLEYFCVIKEIILNHWDSEQEYPQFEVSSPR